MSDLAVIDQKKEKAMSGETVTDRCMVKGPWERKGFQTFRSRAVTEAGRTEVTDTMSE